MTLVICKERQRILDATGHFLITGERKDYNRSCEGQRSN